MPTILTKTNIRDQQPFIYCQIDYTIIERLNDSVKINFIYTFTTEQQNYNYNILNEISIGDNFSDSFVIKANSFVEESNWTYVINKTYNIPVEKENSNISFVINIVDENSTNYRYKKYISIGLGYDLITFNNVKVNSEWNEQEIIFTWDVVEDAFNNNFNYYVIFLETKELENSAWQTIPGYSYSTTKNSLTFNISSYAEGSYFRCNVTAIGEKNFIQKVSPISRKNYLPNISNASLSFYNNGETIDYVNNNIPIDSTIKTYGCFDLGGFNNKNNKLTYSLYINNIKYGEKYNDIDDAAGVEWKNELYAFCITTSVLSNIIISFSVSDGFKEIFTPTININLGNTLTLNINYYLNSTFINPTSYISILPSSIDGHALGLVEKIKIYMNVQNLFDDDVLIYENNRTYSTLTINNIFDLIVAKIPFESLTETNSFLNITIKIASTIEHLTNNHEQTVKLNIYSFNLLINKIDDRNNLIYSYNSNVPVIKNSITIQGAIKNSDGTINNDKMFYKIYYKINNNNWVFLKQSAVSIDTINDGVLIQSLSINKNNDNILKIKVELYYKAQTQDVLLYSNIAKKEYYNNDQLIDSIDYFFIEKYPSDIQILNFLIKNNLLNNTDVFPCILWNTEITWANVQKAYIIEYKIEIKKENSTNTDVLGEDVSLTIIQGQDKHYVFNNEIKCFENGQNIDNIKQYQINTLLLYDDNYLSSNYHFEVNENYILNGIITYSEIYTTTKNNVSPPTLDEYMLDPFLKSLSKQFLYTNKLNTYCLPTAPTNINISKSDDTNE